MERVISGSNPPFLYYYWSLNRLVEKRYVNTMHFSAKRQFCVTSRTTLLLQRVEHCYALTYTFVCRTMTFGFSQFKIQYFRLIGQCALHMVAKNFWTCPPGLIWHANHTMHYKLACKKQFMEMSLVSCFLYGNSMDSLSAIDLYGQLSTLLFFVLNRHPMIFMFFFGIFIPANNFQFLNHMFSTNLKVLKSSLPKGNSRQQLSEFNFTRFCQGKKDIYFYRSLSNTT